MSKKLMKRTLTPDDCTLIVDDASHTIFDLPNTSMQSEDGGGGY